MSEKPIIHVDHRVYHDEPKIVLNVWELNDPMDFPEKVEFSIHRMIGFDEILHEFRRPPSKWVNCWLKLDYLKEPLPILFDTGGRPYVMAPAKLKPVTVKVMIKEQLIERRGAPLVLERILDLLKVATDFCDSCSGPLDTKGGANEWLMYASEGGAVAEILDCPSCAYGNIRWDREFLESHPELRDGFKLKR